MFHLVPPDSTLLAEFLSESLLLGDEEKILTAFELVLTQQRLVTVLVPSGRCITKLGNPDQVLQSPALSLRGR
jgi:hypothetical protein